MPPASWLAVLQNGHKPADSDLKILESLSLNLGLPNPVINALVDFVLQKNDNILSKAYIEKIGAALAREGVKTSLDAMMSDNGFKMMAFSSAGTLKSSSSWICKTIWVLR